MLTALVPLACAMWLSTSRATSALGDAERESLTLIATVTAARLDQLVVDTQRTVRQIAGEGAVLALCGGGDGAASGPAVKRRLELVVEACPDIASAFVVGSAGIGLMSTNPANIGQDLGFREYVREAIAGREHVSGVLVGKTTREPGIYFSCPARDGERVVGAAVVKLRGERVWEIVDAVRLAGRGHAMLLDADGVVLAHRDRDRLFHSLAALDPARIAGINPETQWSIPTIQPMGYEGIGVELRAEAARGAFEFGHPGESGTEPWIAGLAPMSSKGWYVAAVEPREQFEAPVRTLRRQQAAIVIAVAAIAGGVALWRARELVRPTLAISDAASRLAAGDFESRAPVESQDEIGRLASAFNSMVPQLKAHVDLKQSLAVAMEVQQGLLPDDAPTLEGFDIAGRSRYCDATGGDYYDFIDVAQLPSGSAAMVIADVQGHGISAALIMAAARAALRSHAPEETSLATILTKVNRILAANDRSGKFVTMGLLVIDPVSGGARWASAGHDPPIVYRRAADDFIELEGADVPLGVVEGVEYEQHERAGAVSPGDIVVMGTDGIWEAHLDSANLFGKERLRELIREHRDRPAAEIGREIEQAVSAHMRGASAPDDVTYIIAKVR